MPGRMKSWVRVPGKVGLFLGGVAWLLAGASACSGEPEEAETACCELLVLCTECNCDSGMWTVASSGEGLACRHVIDSSTSTWSLCGFSAQSQAVSECTSD